jgi:hypothetical protein
MRLTLPPRHVPCDPLVFQATLCDIERCRLIRLNKRGKVWVEGEVNSNSALSCKIVSTISHRLSRGIKRHQHLFWIKPVISCRGVSANSCRRRKCVPKSSPKPRFAGRLVLAHITENGKKMFCSCPPSSQFHTMNPLEGATCTQGRWDLFPCL